MNIIKSAGVKVITPVTDIMVQSKNCMNLILRREKERERESKGQYDLYKIGANLGKY